MRGVEVVWPLALLPQPTRCVCGRVCGCVGSPGQLEGPTVQERSSVEALTCQSLPP